MGLEINGTWAGKRYKFEEMDAYEVAKLFGVYEQLFPEKGKLRGVVQFVLDPSKVKTVKGQDRQIKQERLPCTFSGKKGGSTISIRYFDTKSVSMNEKGEEQTNYYPRKIELTQN